MRLTDLLRDNGGEKKPSSLFTKEGNLSSSKEDSKTILKKGDKKTVFLQADDLDALYTIKTPADASDSEVSTRQESVIPEQRQQKPDISAEVYENQQIASSDIDEETDIKAPLEEEEKKYSDKKKYLKELIKTLYLSL